MEEPLAEAVQHMRSEITALQTQIREMTLDREGILENVRRANELVDNTITGASNLQVEVERLRSERNKMAALVLTHAWNKFNLYGVIDSLTDPVIIPGNLADALEMYDRRANEKARKIT